MKKIFSFLAAVLCAAGMAFAQDTRELTVYDGTMINSAVPFSGGYVDLYTRSQYIIPASDISALKDNVILQLRYSLKTPVDAYTWEGKVKVYLKEVSYATISSFDNLSGAKMVYEGSLSCDNKEMTITLTDPYTYQGQNLLVAFDNVEKGANTCNCFFHGQTVEGASVYGSSGSSLDNATPAQKNFIPKTTFVHVPPMEPIVENGWVHYDNGMCKNALGLTSGNQFYWGIMIPAGTISEPYLTKVSTYVYNHFDATVYIYQGGNTPAEGTLMHTQKASMTANKEFQEITLLPSIHINPAQNIWIVFSGSGNVASYCTMYNAANARWIATNNNTWQEIKASDYKNIAWMIRGHFTSSPEYHPYARNIVASDITGSSANLTWEGIGAYELRYKKHFSQNNEFSDGLGDWTTIDADGDGYDWEKQSFDIPCIGSASFDNASMTALDPDNYLVSPRLTIGDSITFEAMGLDSKDYAEHFGIAISTTSNTDPNAFTTIWETTLEKDAWQTWKKFKVDLSAYKGQEGYVAIRHFNSSNQYWLYISNVVFEKYDWMVVNDINQEAYVLSNLEPEQEYWVQVKAFYRSEESDWSEIYKFRTIEGTGIEDVNATDKCGGFRKILRNGQIFVLRGDRVYTVTGQEVR